MRHVGLLFDHDKLCGDDPDIFNRLGFLRVKHDHIVVVADVDHCWWCRKGEGPVPSANAEPESNDLPLYLEFMYRQCVAVDCHYEMHQSGQISIVIRMLRSHAPRTDHAIQ